MAKKKAPELLSPEAQAANAAGEARREKEKQARRKNAEKQARFRDSMKADGYRRVTLWDAPAPSGQPGRMAGMSYRQVPAWEKPQQNTNKGRAAKITLAVRIRESSLHVAARSPKVQEALKRVKGEFAAALGDAPEGTAVYSDFIELIALLGDPLGEE
jgi:hypothetical protein